jgi:hypothetical protein
MQAVALAELGFCRQNRAKLMIPEIEGGKVQKYTQSEAFLALTHHASPEAA